MRNANPITWFILNCSVLKKSSENMVKTTMLITSWITFSCTNENGPPLPWYPILLAGTWNRYSNRAIPQLIRIIAINGRASIHFISLNFRWPYHANVMNVLESISRLMVMNPFMGVGRNRESLKFAKNSQTTFMVAKCSSLFHRWRSNSFIKLYLCLIFLNYRNYGTHFSNCLHL